MEIQVHSIENLKTMEVIEITTGTKMGFIKDLKIDCDGFQIISIIIPAIKITWFNKNNFIEIPWDRVRKIGVDVILVDGSDFLMQLEE